MSMYEKDDKMERRRVGKLAERDWQNAGVEGGGRGMDESDKKDERDEREEGRGEWRRIEGKERVKE